MTSPRPRRRLTNAIGPALIAAALAAAIVLAVVSWQVFGAPQPQTEAAASDGCIHPAPARIGGPIALINTAGQAVTEAHFKGAPALVYFGFTHCPDVCPTSLYLMQQALAALGARGAAVQPIFISLDPRRDTPAAMAAYVASGGFPPHLIGLTGSDAQIRAAAQAFAVAFQQAPSTSEDYSVDHTSFVYLLDGDWRVQALMSSIGSAPEAMAACIARGLN